MSLEPAGERDAGPCRVLHVEDDAEFAALTAAYLEREGDIEVHTESNAADALGYLRDDPAAVDCIVSDFQMPGMDGLEFLGAVRETDDDLPFILFTGQGSEEIASDAISVGVTDYFEKSSGSEQFELLANRVEEAVRSHRTEQRLRRTRKRYRRLVEQNVAGIYILQDRSFEYVNPRMAEIFGYTQAEMVSLDQPRCVVAPEDRKKVERHIRDREAGTVDSIQYTFRGRRKDGEEIHLEAHGSRIEYDGDPAIIGVLIERSD